MITDPIPEQCPCGCGGLSPAPLPSHHRRNYVPWSRPDADILGDIRRVTVNARWSTLRAADA